MSPVILDGKKLAKTLQNEIGDRVTKLKAETGVTPKLIAILVGGDPASEVYVRNKHLACERTGLASEVVRLPAETTQQELLAVVNRYNEQADAHGILVQLPLPKHLDTQQILDSIHPLKDVDAFHPENVGLLMQGRPRFLPCTPHGVLQVLHRYGYSTTGKHVVVVGRSDIVGKPMGMLLVQKDSPVSASVANATVTICHSQTPDIGTITRQADVLIVAVGRANFIRGNMIKQGAVVIDVGINRTDTGLCGDVHYEEACTVASAITPVPGGIGPLTVTMLLENTLLAASLQRS